MEYRFTQEEHDAFEASKARCKQNLELHILATIYREESENREQIMEGYVARVCQGFKEGCRVQLVDAEGKLEEKIYTVLETGYMLPVKEGRTTPQPIFSLTHPDGNLISARNFDQIRVIK